MLMRLALIIDCRVVPCFPIVHPNCAQWEERWTLNTHKSWEYHLNRLDDPIFRACQTFSDWVKNSSHIVESCDESCLTDLLGCIKIVAALPTESHSHYGASVHELCVYGMLHCWGYYETLCNGFCGKEKKYQKRTAKKSAADIIEVFTIDPPYNISDELYLVGQIKGKTAAVGKSTNWIKYMEHLLSIGERKIWKGEWGLLHKEQI